MCAARDVPPMTAFLYMPWELLINEANIRKRSPEMATLYDKHPEIFKRHYDAEYLALIVFLWHEKAKGEASFWKPYLDIINFTDMPFLWNDEELNEFQDAVLIANVKRYSEEFDEEWLKVYWMLHRNNYDHIIPGISDYSKQAQFKEDYIWAFSNVVTRCFGWGLPCTTMAPFSDTINHHNVDSSYDVIKAEWRPISFIERMQRYPDPEHPFRFKFGPWATEFNNLETKSVEGEQTSTSASDAQINNSNMPEELTMPVLSTSETNETETVVPHATPASSSTVNDQQVDEESKNAVTLPLDPQAYKKYDLASGENQFYHSVCKSQVDFSFFYDHHVPTKLLPVQ